MTTNTNSNTVYKTDYIVNHFDNHRNRWEEFYPSEQWAFNLVTKNDESLGSVLDVGCAIGGLGKMLAERFKVDRYVGVDINRQAIEKAKTLTDSINTKAEFINKDIVSVNTVEGEPFDLVVSLGCADWNVETNPIISRCWQAVEDGGQFIMSIRLTDKEGINDISVSHQPMTYDDNGQLIETANYVVYNVNEFIAFLKSTCNGLKSIHGYGYWGKPSSDAITPFDELVFAVLVLNKADAKESINGVEEYFEFPQNFIKTEEESA